MKIISLVIAHIYLLYSVSTMQGYFFSDSAVYVITNVSGEKKDIAKVFFRTNLEVTVKKEDLVLKYDKDVNQIYLLRDTALLGYYSVANKSNEILINNHNPFKDQLSYSDQRQREYRLIIKKQESDRYTLSIYNKGEMNMLIDSVILNIKLIKQ